MHNPTCWANHMGAWLLEPQFALQAVNSIKLGLWRPIREAKAIEDDQHEPATAGPRASRFAEGLYSLDENGIAVIPMSGVMMKGYSKYGGCSTVEVRQALRGSVRNPDVRGIMLQIDSPGGSVAGTEELGNDIAMAATKKPLHAHFDDNGNSAAFWAGSQAQWLTANRTANVGSIGTVAVIEDTSKAYEMAGVKVHVISTGDLKGAFSDGVEITDEAIAFMQDMVDAVNKHFMAAVGRGRNLSASDVKQLATGRVWLADEAKKLGLIDEVQSFDGAYKKLLGAVKSAESSARINGARAMAPTRMVDARLKALSEKG